MSLFDFREGQEGGGGTVDEQDREGTAEGGGSCAGKAAQEGEAARQLGLSVRQMTLI